MKHETHSDDSSDIKIRAIENGFIISYIHFFIHRERFFETLEALNKFLAEYYREVK